MNERAMWTIMGTGLATVFLCLFFMIFMITALRLLLEVAERRRREKHPEPAVDRAAVVAAVVGSRVPNEGEVIAVMTAAISAASGRAADSFRIASIEKSASATPEWGRADRVPAPFQRGSR